jgi:hypothetical protein
VHSQSTLQRQILKNTFINIKVCWGMNYITLLRIYY